MTVHETGEAGGSCKEPDHDSWCMFKHLQKDHSQHQTAEAADNQPDSCMLEESGHVQLLLRPLSQLPE